MARYTIACAFLVASVVFHSIPVIADPQEKAEGGFDSDRHHDEGIAEWSWSEALALATGQDVGDLSGWESVSEDQDQDADDTTPRALYKKSWGGGHVRGGNWGYSSHLPHITCPYGGAMQVEHYGQEVCFGVGQGICGKGWKFGIDKFYDTTYLMLWREEDPAHPVFREFPGATRLCIGEKYPNTSYLYVKFGNCVKYLVAPGAGSPDKLARLKIVPDTDKYSPYDTVVKLRDGPGYEDGILQIFANGAYKASHGAFWRKKCFTEAPSSAPSSLPSAAPSVSLEPSSMPSSEPSAVPSSHPSSEPSSEPSSVPSGVPSGMPSSQPSSEPSSAPSSMPSASCTIAEVDNGGEGDGTNVGRFSSLQLNGSNNPVISYYDSNNRDLKLALCQDVDCNNIVSREVVDNDVGMFGGFTSLQLDGDSNPIISYYDSNNNNGNLKLAACARNDCTEIGTRTVVDRGGEAPPRNDVGMFTSLQLIVKDDGSRSPVISYRDDDDGALKLAVCDDTTCTPDNARKNEVVDNGATDVGQFTSLQLNGGIPVIAYFDSNKGDLKLAVCKDGDCENPPVKNIVDGGLGPIVGEYASLQLNDKGYPVISYYDNTNGALKLAVCGDITCTDSKENPITRRVVDDGGGEGGNDVGQFTSLQLDDAGNPVISYYDATAGVLKLAVCHNADCSSPASIRVVDDGDGVNEVVGIDGTSLQINENGDFVISYHGETVTVDEDDPDADPMISNGILKLAVCPSSD